MFASISHCTVHAVLDGGTWRVHLIKPTCGIQTVITVDENKM